MKALLDIQYLMLSVSFSERCVCCLIIASWTVAKEYFREYATYSWTRRRKNDGRDIPACLRVYSETLLIARANAVLIGNLSRCKV
jgi:hypothetical protein